MRVVWKDSKTNTYKPVKYRGHNIYGSKEGWWTDIPSDENLYSSHYCAMNAIDSELGGEGIRGKGTRKRQSYGIQIVGKRNDNV